MATPASVVPAPRGGKREAPVFQQETQLFEGARHPLLSGGLVGSQCLADRAKVEPFVKAKQNGRAVHRPKPVNCFVQDGRNLAGAGVQLVLGRIHCEGLPFTGSTTALAAHGFRRHKARVPMQPAAQFDLDRKVFGEARQVHKDGLGHVLRQVRVTADQPNRRGKDQVEVARDELPKGSFRTLVHVIREQFLAVRHL